MNRRALSASCGLLLGALLTVGCGMQVMPAAEAPAVNGDPVTTAQTSVAAPVSVSIPALNITDEIVPVGLEPNGELEVPDVHEVGYFTGLPAPGADGNGPALLAGHINYEGVTGSFARIGQLSVGDRVIVTDAAGARHEFAVYALTSFKKKLYAQKMPPLLADTAGPELRMVTCSGELAGHSYTDNTVVSARLVT